LVKAAINGYYQGNKSSIKSLPNELLTEVLGHVASTSFTDLFNVKLSCKYFLEVAKDDYIFQRISLEKFPVVPLRISNEASSFFKRCEESGNPESLFRQGMIDYFSLAMIESGLEYLKRVAKVIQKQHTSMGLSCCVLKVN